MKQRRRAGTFATFERRYQPIDPTDGESMRPWDDPDILTAFERGIEGHRLVWTVVDGDNGKLYLVPGFATVNYLGRVLCAKPWDNDEIVHGSGYVW